MSEGSTPAGRLIMVGLPGARLDRSTGEQLEALAPAGVILFARNLETPEQTSELLDAAAARLPGAGLFALDQEGGRVSRLEPFVGPTPTAVALAAEGEEATQRFGAATGRALAGLGFNIDFAPVVDLCDPDVSNGIGDRSFGVDPETATRLAGAFLRGLQGAGVAGSLKHFPGLGDTAVDSHVELPGSDRPIGTLERIDLAPYRALGADAAMVMVGHAHYRAIDPGEPVPATCSRNVVRGLLRDSLGYDGLVVSDDMQMGAIGERDRDGAAAVEAIAAGCDLLLYCSDLDPAAAAISAIEQRAAEDERFAERVRDALARVDRFTRRWMRIGPHRGWWDEGREALGAFRAIA